MAANRDTGNSVSLTLTGSIVTSNTTASAVVIEGFHQANDGTNGGNVTVSNITVGDGGTITISTVPSGLSSARPQSFKGGFNSQCRPCEAVSFIATSLNGNSLTTAVGTAAACLIQVTAGNVVVVANTGLGTGTAVADDVFVTNSIAGKFTATTGSASPSGAINLVSTSGALTINGATNTGKQRGSEPERSGRRRHSTRRSAATPPPARSASLAR